MTILESKNVFKEFFKDLDLIQSHNLELSCLKYDACMVAWSDNSRNVGFRFVFGNKKNKCSRKIDPLFNAPFEKT